MNCRDVPPDLWSHARAAIFMFFSRRLGVEQADEVAQATLLAVLRREDYLFDKEEDFLRVCLGFAKKVAPELARSAERRSMDALDFETAAPSARIGRLEGVETSIYLEETMRLGSEQLSDLEWRLTNRSTVCTGDELIDEFPDEFKNVEALRVQLFRARRKLAKIVGWQKKRTHVKI